jgi:gliding motility-associated protein GldL
MSKLPKVKGMKRFLHLASCLGAGIVIIGALFKIMHWPGASIALIAGLGTEAFLFCLFAIDIPHEDVDWTLVYPEIAGMGAVHHEDEKLEHPEELPLTEQLDHALEQAKIGPELLESLGAGMKSLSENASKIADISQAHSATNEYVDSVKNAAKNVNSLSDSYNKASDSLLSLSMSSESSQNFGEQISKVSKNLSALNASYELQLEGSKEHLAVTSKFYDGLADLMKNLNDSVEDTKKYRQEMGQLSNNLLALNNIYGNMLSAMNYNKGANS